MKKPTNGAETISRRGFIGNAVAIVAGSANLGITPSTIAALDLRQTPNLILNLDSFKYYIDRFNRHDHETIVNYIDNKSSWPWMRANVPFFECPDKDFEEIYYFRWWTYRKHIVKTPVGFVITEFLPPVPWAGRYNTIDCSAGHHFYEGRWIHDPSYLSDYATFWFRKGGNPRRYSFWAANSIYAFYLVHQNLKLATSLLPDLVKNYQAWERTHRDGNGLFWQIDGSDGMEVSIGGSGYRPTINSYMYGDAIAIQKIGGLAKDQQVADEFRKKSRGIRSLVHKRLWNAKADFFETIPRGGNSSVDVREEIGFVPWYFNLPEKGYEAAWKQVMQANGFLAPSGITTAEQRSARFMFTYPHECLWNGPVWPFATTQTLVGMANLLNEYEQTYVSKNDYFMHLMLYAKSQRRRLHSDQLVRRTDEKDSYTGTLVKSHFRRLHDDKVVPWIGEDLDPYTGTWIARRILHEWDRKDKDRGKDYNHSCFCDLVITGLVGLRPRGDAIVEVNPLVPEHTWQYFCLDRILYHGHYISVLYDRTGEHYRKGPGLRLYIDGKQVAAARKLSRLRGKIA